MNHADTIVALGTPIDAALRAIVRMSGKRAFELLDLLGNQRGEELQQGRVARRQISIGNGIAFDVWIYPFFSPRSSTGEDVAELHVPASPHLVGGVIRRLIELGARQAEPGEFTARAFFNGKLDLTSAEGVAAAISASNRAELDAARQLLNGELARRLAPILDGLVRTLALIEVGIDFTEEDVSFISLDELRGNLHATTESLRSLIDLCPRIERLSHEPRIVLTGRPNAGKSTLLNALAGSARAVVSEVAGTTRDALSSRIALRRGFVTLVDVAGLEDAGDDSITRQMQSAAHVQIMQADAVVLIIDSSDRRERVSLPRKPDMVVFSKSDLAPPPVGSIAVDARHGVGLDAFRSTLDQIAFGSNAASGVHLSINARHVEAIHAALGSIERARSALQAGPEFIAFELRASIDQLGSVIGNVSPDDVLGRIFSGFCIGK